MVIFHLKYTEIKNSPPPLNTPLLTEDTLEQWGSLGRYMRNADVSHCNDENINPRHAIYIVINMDNSSVMGMEYVYISYIISSCQWQWQTICTKSEDTINLFSIFVGKACYWPVSVSCVLAACPVTEVITRQETRTCITPITDMSTLVFTYCLWMSFRYVL